MNFVAVNVFVIYLLWVMVKYDTNIIRYLMRMSITNSTSKVFEVNSSIKYYARNSISSWFFLPTTVCWYKTNVNDKKKKEKRK